MVGEASFGNPSDTPSCEIVAKVSLPVRSALLPVQLLSRFGDARRIWRQIGQLQDNAGSGSQLCIAQVWQVIVSSGGLVALTLALNISR